MSVTPYLLYEDVAAAMQFLSEAFGLHRYGRPVKGEDGKINHASMRIGDDEIMMGCPGPEYRNPKRLGQVTQNLYVIVKNVEKHFKHTCRAGAQIIEEPNDTFYGHRRYAAEDPEGHLWYFAEEIIPANPGEKAKKDKKMKKMKKDKKDKKTKKNKKEKEAKKVKKAAKAKAAKAAKKAKKAKMATKSAGKVKKTAKKAAKKAKTASKAKKSVKTGMAKKVAQKAPAAKPAEKKTPPAQPPMPNMNPTPKGPDSSPAGMQQRMGGSMPFGHDDDSDN
jgi:uncharacterized glyoxalase superfamily protein PhnB